MQEFEHIQSLWQSHTVEVKISSDEMLTQVKKEVSYIRQKSSLNLLGMVLSFIAIAALWLFFDFHSWTTHAGITLIIAAIAFSTYNLYRGHRLISKYDFTAHPAEFLGTLKAYQLSRYTLYHKLYWLYAGCISLGALLYFSEALQNLSPWLQISLLLFSILWMILSATVLRKAYIKKEKERLNLLIEKFKRLGNQFQEED